MAEFNSAPYFPIDLKGLCALYALAPDADIRERAGKAILRLLEVVARSAHHGQITGAQGRSYEHTLRASRSLELSGICRMVWGKGNYGMRFHALPQLALCLRDHGSEVPAELTGISPPSTGRSIGNGCSRKARTGSPGSITTRPATTPWAPPPLIAGTSGAIRKPSSRSGSGAIPDAQIWINHPGEVLQSGYGRPSYWGGSGTLPRVHQYRALAVARV
jgi:hypothetical protein